MEIFWLYRNNYRRQKTLRRQRNSRFMKKSNCHTTTRTQITMAVQIQVPAKTLIRLISTSQAVFTRAIRVTSHCLPGQSSLSTKQAAQADRMRSCCQQRQPLLYLRSALRILFSSKQTIALPSQNKKSPRVAKREMKNGLRKILFSHLAEAHPNITTNYSLTKVWLRLFLLPTIRMVNRWPARLKKKSCRNFIGPISPTDSA